MRVGLRSLSFALAFVAATASAQSNPREPHIGYLYPAGGSRGSAFWITVGGQYLRGASGLHVTGEGVAAVKVRYMGRFRRLNREQRQELQRRLRKVREKQGGRLARGDRGSGRKGKESPREDGGRSRPKEKDGDPPAAAAILPNHPLLRNLEALSPRELEFVEHGFLQFDRRRQPNSQIGEFVLLQVAIDPDAIPGDRELRLRTPRGLTNPLCFQVGLLPEISEPEPYDVRARETPPVEAPILLNGQIKPGDVDRFCFRAEEGQRLVFETRARHLVPYLADAVPGWFQATLTLYDATDREVAFVDDWRLGPDPVLFYEVPETGLYKVEIRDSIYRGREDFVYRLTVGEQPFIKSLFPLGGRVGEDTVATVDGWNLETNRLVLDTRPGGAPVRKAAVHQEGGLSNSVTYAVDDLTEWGEAEPNDTRQEAQRIDPPGIVNGRIGMVGDEDVFQFHGEAGDEVVAEVLSRRLHSPVDSLLKLTDPSGRCLAWNDDHEYKAGHLYREMGPITHHADSYLRLRLPEDGIYYLKISDSQLQGGEEYGYRLRVGPPRPDFDLRVTPSSINVRAGGAAVLTVHALRKDGFDGEIELRLKNAPPGYSLQGGRISAGRDSVRMTLTAPRKPQAEPASLQLEGSALLYGEEVLRRAVPSEEMMQAFLYRHLVPSQELVVAVLGSGGRGPSPGMVDPAPVRIPVGGTAEVQIRVPMRPKLKDIHLELCDPPDGVTLRDVTVTPGHLTLVLESGAAATPSGVQDNLIVRAFTERARPGPGGKPAGQKQRIFLGVLPAIPFEIVEP